MLASPPLWIRYWLAGRDQIAKSAHWSCRLSHADVKLLEYLSNYGRIRHMCSNVSTYQQHTTWQQNTMFTAVFKSINHVQNLLILPLPTRVRQNWIFISWIYDAIHGKEKWKFGFQKNFFKNSNPQSSSLFWYWETAETKNELHALVVSSTSLGRVSRRARRPWSTSSSALPVQSIMTHNIDY